MVCRVLNWNLAVALQDRSQGVDDCPLETWAPQARAAEKQQNAMRCGRSMGQGSGSCSAAIQLPVHSC